MEPTIPLTCEQILQIMDNSITDMNLLSVWYEDEDPFEYYYINKTNIKFGNLSLREIVNDYILYYISHICEIVEHVDEMLELLNNNKSIEKYIETNYLIKRLIKDIRIEDNRIDIHYYSFILSTKENMEYFRSKIEENIRSIITELQ